MTAQRQWLRNKRNICTNALCVKQAYETRLNELKWYLSLSDQTPDTSLVKTLCEQLVAKTARDQILAQQSGIEDINNDGRPETSESCDGGNMRTPCTDYFDRDGKQIGIEQVGFEWKDYWTYGIKAFRYAEKTFFLNTSDDELQEPSYLSYITPKNKEHVLCEFSSLKISKIASQSPDNDGVCQAALQSSDLIQPVEFSKDSDIPPDFLKRPSTYVNGVGLIDIDNDGTMEKILELKYESGGGRGCDYNYYELLDSSGKKLSSEKKRLIFLVMQGAGESGYMGRSCGHIVNRLFRYKNKTFYENNVENQQGEEDTISLLKNNTSEIICKYGSEIETELKHVK